jgi:hypothetical protein
MAVPSLRPVRERAFVVAIGIVSVVTCTAGTVAAGWFQSVRLELVVSGDRFELGADTPFEVSICSNSWMVQWVEFGHWGDWRITGEDLVPVADSDHVPRSIEPTRLFFGPRSCHRLTAVSWDQRTWNSGTTRDARKIAAAREAGRPLRGEQVPPGRYRLSADWDGGCCLQEVQEAQFEIVP